MLETSLPNRFAVTAVLLFGIGFMNLLLQQNLLKKVVGFNIMDSAVFMLLASLGYIEGRVAPVMGEGVLKGGCLGSNTVVGTNDLNIFVCGNETQAIVAAQFDNLGKGASGAAVQNLNIMMGVDENYGL